MKKKTKYIIPIITLFLSLLCCTYVLAADGDDIAKGSIEILLTDGDIGTSKENVEFEYAKVADVKDGRYYLLADYGNLDLNELKSSADLDEAAQLINAKIQSGKTIQTDNMGRAVITDLEIGVYLLRVSNKARYENVSPVLIAIPTWNEAEGDMDYNVTVIPKHTANQPGEIITSTPDHTNSNTVMTGDTNHFIPYFVLLVGAVAMIYLCARKKERWATK